MAASYFTERTASPITNGSVNSILSPTTPSTAAPRSNALQNRITSVLSASYADSDTRDALSILDARHLTNTAAARRNLRLDVQQELIECNGEIVQDFGRVAEQLQRVGVAIGKLKETCVELRKHVGAANRDTGPMLDEAKTLTKEKQDVEGKQQLLDAFKAHFVLSDTDLALLTSTAEPVDDDFFRILTRARRTREDSQVLLGYENQRLGLEILEHSSRQLNSAFQKLYRWVQREFKTLDLENLQISGDIRRALRVLAERPTLFRNCLDFFAEARENILSNNFHAALTGARVVPDHPVMGRAIELSAHDPLRYVSDMLAWAHSATVSEREALEVLFISEGDEIAKSIQAGIESEPWSRSNGDDGAAPVFDGRKALNELVDRDLSGVFRQLRQRTEQVAQSHEDATLTYKISNLVTFYTSIFSSLLGPDSALLGALSPLAENTMRNFRSIMRDHVTSLQSDITLLPTDDLSPPDFLTDALQVLEMLMRSYDTSIISGSLADRKEGFQPVLREALDPFLGGCENITRRLRAPDSQILALNCLHVTKDTLKKFAFADRTDELQPRIEEHKAQLEQAMFTWFSRESGLENLIADVAGPDDLATAYQDPSQLARSAQQLDAFLPTATDEARTFLSQLQDRALARRVINDAAESFCEDFERIEDIIIAADAKRSGLVNGEVEDEAQLREVFPRTGGEIRVLLS